MSETPEQYGENGFKEYIGSLSEEPKKFLDIAAIFSTPTVATEDVYVKAWGGWVRVKGMTAAERDAFEDGLLQGKGKDREVNRQNIRAKLVARTVVDPKTGDRMFRDAHAEKLGGLLAAGIDVLFDAAQRLSGFKDEDIEELGKPSEPTSEGDSSID